MQSEAIECIAQDTPAGETEAAPVAQDVSALRAFISRRTRLRHEVDDLLQECYIRLLTAQRNGTVDQPRSYLFRTAKNLLIDRLRRQSASPIDVTSKPPDELELASAAPTPEDAAIDACMQRAFEAALAELPESTRRVFYLVRFGGLTSSEAAERLGVSTRMVQKHLKRCVTHLYARMHTG